MIVTKIATTILLFYGIEDVKELADAAHFVISGKGMRFGECGFNEARL